MIIWSLTVTLFIIRSLYTVGHNRISVWCALPLHIVLSALLRSSIPLLSHFVQLFIYSRHNRIIRCFLFVICFFRVIVLITRSVMITMMKINRRLKTQWTSDEVNYHKRVSLGRARIVQNPSLRAKRFEWNQRCLDFQKKSQNFDIYILINIVIIYGPHFLYDR